MNQIHWEELLNWRKIYQANISKEFTMMAAQIAFWNFSIFWIIFKEDRQNIRKLCTLLGRSFHKTWFMKFQWVTKINHLIMIICLISGKILVLILMQDTSSTFKLPWLIPKLKRFVEEFSPKMTEEKFKIT